MEDTKENIRRVARAGMEAGANPRTTALDIVGRVNRATGRREGGVIGLTTHQEQWARNALAELRSGDPATMARYLERQARDGRFDRAVRKAIREGKPVPADQARKIVSRYRDGLLRYRGEVIARTETLASLHEAQDEGMRQMIDGGQLRAEQITRIWDSAGDSRTRDSHRAMDGQKRAVGEAFISGDGHRLAFPGDGSLGAPASETIQCRCAIRIDIDYLGGGRP